ncbi:hypothetical protein DSO57_1039431, partial [Entomophthora muscae]
MKTKALELTPSNSRCAPLPVFQVGDMVLYYQHQVGGRAHKSDSLWIGPLKVPSKRDSEYTVKLLSTERPFARVHAKFLHKYTPKANLEGAMLGILISMLFLFVAYWRHISGVKFFSCCGVP